MRYIEDWNWLDFEEVESTNDEAKKLSENAISSKFVITSKKQTQGRGRRGRTWESIEGNLFASFVLKMDIKYLGALSFIVSLSILDTIKQFDAYANLKLKWPNDVLLDDKKVSGILIERAGDEYFVIGVGVNIVDYPKDINLIYEATSLLNEEIQTDRDVFLNKYIKCLNANIDAFYNNGFGEIRDRWLMSAKDLNREILVKSDNGDKVGIFVGVDDNGYLLLDVDNKVEKIYAGDVFYI